MKCDIIIPVWNQLESTRECVESIIRTTKYPYRFILIDNGSDNETKLYLEGLRKRGSPEAVIIRNEENLGYIKAVNQGLEISNAPYVCLMNNDTVPGAGWLEKLVAFAEAHKEIGLMNPLCKGHMDLSIDDYAKNIEKNGDRYMEMNQCFGFCTLIKREVVEKIGCLDETFGIGGYDDTDYSMRAGRAGYRCASVHSSYVYHKEHVSFKAMGQNRETLTRKGEEEYFKKWPRHLRIGILFFVNDRVGDIQIENMLKTVLSLAREWCWINFWIVGRAEENKRRVDMAAKRIEMPLHQNIKFNFIPKPFAGLQALVRLIERSFGTKKRKKYDVIFADNNRSVSFLNFFYPIHRTRVILVKPEAGMAAEAGRIIADIRKIK